MAKMIVVNAERCLACRTCVLECAMAHTDVETIAETVGSQTPPQPRVHVEPLGDRGMPLQCRHCQDAACMDVCPAEAIGRDSPDGPVLIDADLCVGCRLCLVVCPFGAIDMSPDRKKALKCDLCVQRTRSGLEPACVAGCPTKAIDFRELDDSLRSRRKEQADLVLAAVTGGGPAEHSGSGTVDKADAADPEPGKCSRCSVTFARPGQLRRLKEKSPQRAVPTLCPACRRHRTAQASVPNGNAASRHRTAQYPSQTATPPHGKRPIVSPGRPSRPMCEQEIE